MSRGRVILLCIFVALFVTTLGRPCAAAETQSGSVYGTVRDSTGLPLPGVTVEATAAGGGVPFETTTDAQGRYLLAPPAGAYEIHVALPGFRAAHLHVDVRAGQRAALDVRLDVEPVSQQVTVNGDAGGRASFSRTFVTRSELDHIPGALQSGSCTAITELSPSAVVAHDELHVRGGHQVGYEIDGVAVPTTSIAANFALLFDPKDVEAIDFQRGAYSAEYGDRLYGMVDVVTRSGFERAKGGESTVIAGQNRTVEGALAFGDHTQKVAYFAQASANRSDLGLTPSSLPVANDRTWGAGGAARLWVAQGTGKVLTLTASARSDDYEIPGTPTDESPQNTQAERDAYVHAQWNHTGGTHGVWSLTPYYHYNRVALNPNAPASSLSVDDRATQYAGMKGDWSAAFGRHLLKVGADGYAAMLNDRFLLPIANAAGSTSVLGDVVSTRGANTAAFIEDVYRPGSHVTATFGLRWDRSQSWQTESAVEPRLGLQAAIPGTPLTAHVYAGRFFQPPPFEALGVGGAQFAAAGDQAFLLVRAERNTQWETGLTLPVGDASVDVTYYDNHARNFLDHEQLGDSSVFLPVNVAQARLRGLEVSASTAPGRRWRGRLVFAHGYAQARGGVTGGLGDIEPRSDTGYFFLDHDQRNSAVASLDWTLVGSAWTHVAVQYGSGFLRADGPDHLPGHVTADLAAGFTVAGRWNIAMDVLNVTDARYFVNLSSEFNGTHLARPRQVAMRICAKF